MTRDKNEKLHLVFMFVTIVSFLLCFAHLFPSGAVKTVSIGAYVSFSSASPEHQFRNLSVFRDQRLPMEVADIDDLEEDVMAGLLLVTRGKTVTRIVCGQRSSRIYRARSCLDDTPLFLLHCNFRV